MKPPVVVITGWGCTAERLKPLTDVLEEDITTDITVIDPLNRPKPPQRVGPGEGPSPYVRYLDDHLQNVAGPAILIGWSMGGMVALEQAAGFPDTVAALVLIGSTARFCRADEYPHGSSPVRVQAMMGGMMIKPDLTLARFFREVAHPHKPAPEVLKEYVRDTLTHPQERLKEGLRYLLATDLRTLIPQIEVPVLILHGRDDAIIPSAAAEWLDSALRDSHLVEYPDMGHDLPLQMPGKVVRDIAGFIEGLP